MVRVAVIGATGYTALELLKLLARHESATVTVVTSRQYEGVPLHTVHPALESLYDLKFSAADVANISNNADVVFCCLPHAASAEFICQFDDSVKIVDLSADYRLNDVETYESLYKTRHPQPELVGQTAYGLPEWFASEISQSRLVANPGCFPTTAILALAPLIKNQIIDTTSIVVDSKTGLSGAGRTEKLAFHFPECNESMWAYGVGSHRHGPEMEQIIQRATGVQPQITFVPHIIPVTRGILSTIYVHPTAGNSVDSINAAWREIYDSQPFVRFPEQSPQLKNVAHTNFCDLWCQPAGEHIVLVSAIDNLIKGASGAAVQNFNLMIGCDQRHALC